MTDRKSPSGPLSSIKGTIAIASLSIPGTSTATAVGTFVPFSGPPVTTEMFGVVNLSPRVNLNANFVVAWKRVLATDTVVIAFANVDGSEATLDPVTFDADIQIE